MTKPSHHMSDNHQALTSKLFFGKYKPDKKLGEGSFGQIYSAVNVTNQELFALKMEPKDCSQNLLEGEAYILSYLKGYGIPFVKSYGYSGDYNVLVMELCGKSLEEIFEEKKKKFSLKTVCMIGIQMIDRIEYIHSKNIMHRDIKPDNFVIGLNKKEHIIYLLDFGLSKKYRSSRTKEHIKFVTNKRLTGTARYASINALSGFEQSRRDDLEGIGYVLLYFLRGSLPWQGLKVNKNEDKYKKILHKKKETSAETLCEGFPSQFVDFIKYTRGLEFTQDPDYNYLRNLLLKVITDSGEKMDFYFDWMSSPPVITKEDLLANKNIFCNNKNLNTNDLTPTPNNNNTNNNASNQINDDPNIYKHKILSTGFDSNESKPTGNKNSNNNSNNNANKNETGEDKKDCIII